MEIIAEDGTTGWGECFGPARLNAAVVGAMAADLIGKDALATEHHWQHLYNRFRDQLRAAHLGESAGEDISPAS